MTDTSRNVGTGTSVPGQYAPPREVRGQEPTGWVGWIVFGATMMLILGSFQAIEGLVAIFKDQYFLVAKSGLVVNVDYTAWGWVQLVIGAITILAGAALFSGRMWARIVAVALAVVSAIVNISFLAAYPVWSALMIGLDVLVIWAVTVHGSEMKAYRR